MTSQSQPSDHDNSVKRPPYLTGQAIVEILRENGFQIVIYPMDTYLFDVEATRSGAHDEDRVRVSVGKARIVFSFESTRRECARLRLPLDDPDSVQKVRTYIEEWL